jgi:hypothetical protein
MISNSTNKPNSSGYGCYPHIDDDLEQHNGHAN